MGDNMGKNDKKEETKATPVAPAIIEVPVTPQATPQAMVPAAPSKALTVIDKLEKLGVAIPTAADVARMGEAVDVKRQALAALIHDTELTEPIRAKVSALFDLANPNKPGMEEVSANWSPARVLVHQPTTNDAKKPESSKPGNLYSTAGQLLEMPFPLIPIYFSYENINFEQGQKAPVCQSPDGKLGSHFGLCAECPYLPFGLQNAGRGDQKKTTCNAQVVVVMLSADLGQIYICQFGKTSKSAGSALVALAKAHPFPWKQSYLLSTEKKTGDLGTYWVLKIEPTGKDNTPEAVKVAKVLSELYGAERKRFLADYYLRMSVAPLQAAAMEAEATMSMVSAGLGEGDGEADLSSPVATSVRSASKPM